MVQMKSNNISSSKGWGSLLRRHGLFVLIGALIAISIFRSTTTVVVVLDSNLLSELHEPVDVTPSTSQQKEQQRKTTASTFTTEEEVDKDKDCIFRDSPLYRKVFVYPNPGETGWEGDILSEQGRNNITAMQWPWLSIDATARAAAAAHYNVNSQIVQYTTELLVRELMVHPDSCLRTYDPEQADLFYVPYLPSTEHHVGHEARTDYSFSPYGKAIMEILDQQKYDQWEELFGMTSKYWKRRNGADHILVFSEPMHGLFHPRSKRGNYHFIHSQKQLTPPIVISVELSTAFVDMYPNCAAKNILVPYPNTHGDWFNGKLFSGIANRSVSQYYSAGNHGTCTKLRRAMKKDYACSPSARQLHEIQPKMHFSTGMRHSVFCPCPGGDSPSAKRMFDSLIAGCIPLILSKDFVWPFTNEFDPTLALDPSEFSIRLAAQDYDTELLDSTTCQPLNATQPGLQAYLDALSPATIQRLQTAAQKAGALYSWYQHSPDVPTNPLQAGYLPNGGTAHFVVAALAERARGNRWPSCEAELERVRPLQRKDPMRFEC